jgi:cell division protein FtsL
MGLPARKQEQRVTARRPHLRVVESKAAGPKKATKKRSRAAQHAAARQAFVFFAVLVVVVAVLGAGRVWLSVQAAQASLDCGKLRVAIKAARYEGDMLEIQRSALSSPSRIQAAAVGQLGMGPATSVSYLNIDSRKSPEVAAVPSNPQGPKRPAMFETLMGIAVAQARMLLVGDVGLASSR